MGSKKTLECDFCKITESIEVINFPEDLYDLFVKYSIDQLLWICSSCKKKKEQNFLYCLSLAEKQKEMELQLYNVSIVVKELQMNAKLHTNMNSMTYLTELSDSGVSNGISQFSFESLPSSKDTSNCGSPPLSECSPSCSSSSRNEPVAILQDILKNKIKIDEVQSRNSKSIVTSFLDILLKKLKALDATFDMLYQKSHYTGSFYEDLRIKSATEFDINLVLRLPYKQSHRKVEFLKDVKSFAKYKLDLPNDMQKFTDEERIRCHHDTLLKLFFENNYLIPTKVKSWMQSILTQVVEGGFAEIESVMKVSLKDSGPAKTVMLETIHGYTIDIDLVPVLEFTFSEWPKDCDSTILDDFSVPESDRFWILVPKSYLVTTKDTNITVADSQCMWRMHFPGVEKHILHRKGCTKSLIRLLKLMRDKGDWKILSSYYLKTVVMWQVKEHPDQEYWKDNKMHTRLIEVLKKLRDCVADINIPYFFYPDFNLLQKLQQAHADNLYHRLRRIITAIEKDFKKIREYL